MVAKRKQSVCAGCGHETDKTVPNHYAQLKRLGFVLCTNCSLKRNAKNTSKRLLQKYSKTKKNSDIITTNCSSCGKSKTLQRRSRHYDKCKSCAAKLNIKQNKYKYISAAKNRKNNTKFKQAVSKGMMSKPKEIRIKSAQSAANKGWEKNLTKRFELFIKKSTEIHNGKYNYIKSNYINSTTPLIIICPKHGNFQQTPQGHLYHKYGCPRCSEVQTISSAHKQIKEYITTKINTKIIDNTRSIINPFEIDIWIPDIKLGIEHHGIYWHSYNNQELPCQKTLHKTKSDLSNHNGIQLLQIFETEWILKQDIVKSIISSKIGTTNRIYARKCTKLPLNQNEYTAFMNKNHLQGYRPSSYTIGLYFEGILVSAIGISRHPKYQYELIRYTTTQNLTVVGGLSKLLAQAKKDLRYNNLLTYADRRYSVGLGYLACGFTHLCNTRPNYYYTKGDKNKPLISRQHFQKHKLSKRLDTYNPKLSESENMFANNYRRIWDAGHCKLVWSST